MKPLYLLITLAGVSLCLYSCKKDSNSGKISITGKWNLVSDTVNAGVNNGVPVIYKGQPGNYFNFSADGHLYIKEGAVLDTVSYNVVSANQVSIAAFMSMADGGFETCQLTGLTANSAVIVSPLFSPPGGPQQRKVGLTR
jgi:hypothetical protein